MEKLGKDRISWNLQLQCDRRGFTLMVIACYYHGSLIGRLSPNSATSGKTHTLKYQKLTAGNSAIELKPKKPSSRCEPCVAFLARHDVTAGGVLQSGCWLLSEPRAAEFGSP